MRLRTPARCALSRQRRPLAILAEHAQHISTAHATQRGVPPLGHHLTHSYQDVQRQSYGFHTRPALSHSIALASTLAASAKVLPFEVLPRRTKEGGLQTIRYQPHG